MAKTFLIAHDINAKSLTALYIIYQTQWIVSSDMTETQELTT